MQDRCLVDWRALRVRGRLTHAGYQSSILPDPPPHLPIGPVEGRISGQDHVVAGCMAPTVAPAGAGAGAQLTPAHTPSFCMSGFRRPVPADPAQSEPAACTVADRVKPATPQTPRETLASAGPRRFTSVVPHGAGHSPGVPLERASGTPGWFRPACRATGVPVVRHVSSAYVTRPLAYQWRAPVVRQASGRHRQVPLARSTGTPRAVGVGRHGPRGHRGRRETVRSGRPAGPSPRAARAECATPGAGPSRSRCRRKGTRRPRPA